MHAGDLRNRVGFYQRVALGDPDASPPDELALAGNRQGDFETTPSFTVAANIKPKLGGEDVLAGRLTGRNLVNITVRRSAQTAAVGTDWKAKDERSGEDYAIHSIIDPFEHSAEHGRWLEMLCEKGVAA